MINKDDWLTIPQVVSEIQKSEKLKRDEAWMVVLQGILDGELPLEPLMPKLVKK